ncbi:MAG: hypothetical protein LUB59_03175 [Candidatus Gastranaerophilales bacterium]|nr:hypothetical protein [Candidatus Gastranaerophilales bacterium]
MTADFNFDSLKANGFTNTLTNRGANKRSGVSYDYMDKLNVLVDQGIFYDKDGDGFTNAEKRALEDEFIKLHTEKGYKTNFRTMQAGTSNDYTFEDFVRLAQAAGYIMKEQPAPAVEEETPAAVEEEAPAAVEEETPAAVEEEAPAEVEKEEGNEVISQSGKAILAQIVAQLPDRNGVEATIDFSGTSATDEQTGEVVYQKGSATVTYADGQTIKVKIDTDKKGNQTVTVEPSNDIAGAPVARAVETPVAVEEEAPEAGA